MGGERGCGSGERGSAGERRCETGGERGGGSGERGSAGERGSKRGMVMEGRVDGGAVVVAGPRQWQARAVVGMDEVDEDRRGWVTDGRRR